MERLHLVVSSLDLWHLIELWPSINRLHNVESALITRETDHLMLFVYRSFVHIVGLGLDLLHLVVVFLLWRFLFIIVLRLLLSIVFGGGLLAFFLIEWCSLHFR